MTDKTKPEGKGMYRVELLINKNPVGMVDIMGDSIQEVGEKVEEQIKLKVTKLKNL